MQQQFIHFSEILAENLVHRLHGDGMYTESFHYSVHVNYTNACGKNWSTRSRRCLSPHFD